MNKSQKNIRPGTDIPFDKEQREGEIYARSARVQLSLFSFIKLALWIAVGEGLLTASFNTGWLITRGAETGAIELALNFTGGILFGALRILAVALLMFPIYRWACERRRGQVMRGKFSAIIPINASNDSPNSD